MTPLGGVHDHLLSWLPGVIAGATVAVGVALATRFQLLPDVVDPSFILTGSGLGGLLGAAIAASCRLPGERLARVVLLGNVLGGLGFTILFLLGTAGVL